MKNYILSICLLFHLGSYCQIGALAKENKQDFVTPDHPAFKILGVDPSNILRPSNIKEFSTITADYFKPPAYVIPRSFSAEISPALLAQSNKLDVFHYAKHWMGYGCRISVATQGVDDKWQKRELGLGFRMTVIDDGDFRKDERFLTPFRQIVNQADSLVTQPRVEKINKLLANDADLQLLEKEASEAVGKPDEDEKAKAYELARKKKKASLTLLLSDSTRYNDANAAINKLRATYLADNWNANRLDWGIAVKLITPDTVFSKNMQYNKVSAWVAGSQKVEGKAGRAQQQLLFGFNINSEYKKLDVRDTTYFSYTADSTGAITDSQEVSNKISNDSINQHILSYSFSARYYIGTNRIKGFAELQIGGTHTLGHKHLAFEEGLTSTRDFKVHSFKLLLNAGIEANITDGVWLMANAGYKLSYDSDSRTKSGSLSSNFVYQLNFRFNLPEKFKLF